MDQVAISARHRKGRPMIPLQGVASRAITGAVCLAFTLCGGQARAQFSSRDGYSESGEYRVQVEITPYLWLPATSGTARIGGSFVGRDVSFDSGPPSIADLAHSLHGAVVAYGLVRYGPWSAELDFQWIDAFHHSTV